VIRNQTYMRRRTDRLRREEAQRAHAAAHAAFMDQVRRAQMEGVAQAIANAVVHTPAMPSDAAASGSITH